MSESGNKIAISYVLDDFMKFKPINMVMPVNLVPFCEEYGGDVIIREHLLTQTSSIIDQFLSGKNPNDIIFKNVLVECLNKVSFKTYDLCLETLKGLNYSTRDHLETLSFEIVMRGMTDTIVVKGIELPEGQRTPSELYADIAADFSSLSIGELKFITVLKEMCQKYFTDFIDTSKPLDQNNQNRVDNFKGFVNFIGLLFNCSIISHNIVLSCLTSLKDLMMYDKWGQVESENIFDGYTKLITQILAVGEKKNIRRNTLDINYLNKVISVHADIKKNNDIKPKLRKFSMLAHKDLDSRLNKLINLI